MTDDPLTFTHHRAGTAEQIIDSVITKLYIDTHADVIDDPFYSAERFVQRIRGYMRAPGFELVTGSVDDMPVGLALGYALPENARWWAGLTTPAEPGFTTEDGTRTFGLCELMVHPNWQARGIAHAIHDELFTNRPEQRASLLVRSNNTSAQRAYAKWGWQHAGKLQPFPDSPHYDVLVLDLTTLRARAQASDSSPVTSSSHRYGSSSGSNELTGPV
jgi:ribosomal protein S18 acetylase RimI-like enzyme